MNTEPLQRSETFTVGDAARLKLANIRGRVDIQAGAPGVITVHAVQHAGGHQEATVIDLSQSPDGTVTVETRFQDGLAGWLSKLGWQPCRVDYTVRVPVACSVDLSVVECETLIQGISGDCIAHTVSGNLRLADLSGGLRLHTVSGNVFGERIAPAGAASFHSVSGSVTLLASDLPAATATTVSGDLSLQTRLGAGPYIFNSVSGNVRLSVPAGTRCSVSLYSQSGRIHNTTSFNHPRTQGEPAGPTVRLHSVSGDLWLLGSDDALVGAAADAMPPTAPPASPAPHRRELLERLSRGDLSVEAAMAALKAPSR